MSPTSRHLVHELVVPATAEFVATTRIFIGGVAGAVTDDPDLVDDLKLATSELVTAMVESGVAHDVRLVVTIESLQLVVQLAPWPANVESDGFGALDIVDALFPGTAVADGAVLVPVALGDHA
jgi:anti-sigma regulatory factor (Ser/Thr protein kinase)